MDKGAEIIPDEAREAFQEVIKFALIMSIISVVFVIIQEKLRKFLKGRRK